MDKVTATNAPQTESFAFSGTAAAYFRIWIVNLCLTIVTLGIYSPWAKVRRNKYLYRNTQLAGGAFDYHADPVAILKGRAIAVVLLGAYALSAWLQPGLETLVFVLLILVLPWLLVRSRMFALRNTSYRNIRFSYRPAFREAYKVVLGFYAIGLITLGLALPWARYHRARMLTDNSRFGSLDLHMSDEVRSGNFYSIYFGVSLFGIVGGIFVGLLFLPVFQVFGVGADAETGAPNASLLSLLSLFLFAPLYLAIFFALNAAITRVTLNKLRVGEHTIKCHWSLPSLVSIQVSNLVLIFLSLGLLIPWATVRVQRYMLSNLVLEPVGNLDQVLAGEAEDVSALGEEIGEAFDFDLGSEVLQALLYDGRTSAGQAVEIRLQSWGVLELVDGRHRRSWDVADLAVADRVGDCAAVIELPDGARLEVTDADEFYAAYAQLGGPGKHWLHWLEGRWTTVLACLVLIIGLTAWALIDGLPLAARVVADLMPQSAQQAIGREGAELLDSYLFEPSKLTVERQTALRAVFDDVLTDVGDGGNYELRFRRSEALGANAIALPAGIVFLTDELVELAENDQELAAVLAHEVGHVLNQHALRALLQNSVAAGFIVAITGDLGSAANLAAGIPTLLLNAAYSRDFEREADEVAYAYLRQNDIDPRRLGELLLRVDQRYGRNSGETSLLSTHPGALERLEGALDETAPEAE